MARRRQAVLVGCQALGCRQDQALRAAHPPRGPAPRSLRRRPKASAARPHARAILCGNCAKAVSLVNFRRQVERTLAPVGRQLVRTSVWDHPPGDPPAAAAGGVSKYCLIWPQGSRRSHLGPGTKLRLRAPLWRSLPSEQTE